MIVQQQWEIVSHPLEGGEIPTTSCKGASPVALRIQPISLNHFGEGEDSTLIIISNTITSMIVLLAILRSNLNHNSKSHCTKSGHHFFSSLVAAFQAFRVRHIHHHRPAAPSKISSTATHTSHSIVRCLSIHEERHSLANLYFATNGAGWRRSDKWLTGDHHCDWQGVDCNSELNVDRLYLGSNQLTGSISESIGNLKNLNCLDLSFNHIPIPVG